MPQPPIVRSQAEPEKHHNRFWPLADLFVGRHMEPLLGQIMPLHDRILGFHYHHEEEFVFVLWGVIEFLIKTAKGTKHEELHRGDCIYFRSGVPHCLRSPKETPAESIHVLSATSVPMETGWPWFMASNTAYLADESHDITQFIGRELCVLRDAHGWAVEQLAPIVGLTRRQLEQIERGKRAVPIDVLIKLARVFGKPLRHFINVMRRDGPSYSLQRSRNIQLTRQLTRRTPIELPNHHLPLSTTPSPSAFQASIPIPTS